MNTRLQILIPEGLDARVKRAAQRKRMSEAERVRWALERALEEPREGTDPVDRLAGLGGPTAGIGQMFGEIGARRAREHP